jgi:hypothetical protein
MTTERPQYPATSGRCAKCGEPIDEHVGLKDWPRKAPVCREKVRA